MRVPRLRFTVRRIMIVVALVALALWGGRMYQRWSYCQRRAAYHDQRRVIFERLKSQGFEMRGDIVLEDAIRPAGRSAGVEQPLEIEYVHSVAEAIGYHAAMKERYLRAAWRPWVSLPPAPSRP
jgi:hypothetical protein